MKSVYIVKYGISSRAFEIRQVAIPHPKENEVLIKVEAFGLNFADVIARRGLYRDFPPLPAVPGYDVVGRVASSSSDFKEGERVIALTRFGGYAEYVAADSRAVFRIPETFPTNFAASLATQYCTAYYACMEASKVYEGENILVHAAAGGVGTALVQLLKLRKAIVIGTCSTQEKVNYLKSLGVDYPINYSSHDYKTEVKRILGRKKIDTVYNSLGGKFIRDGMKLLSPGGKMVCFGGAELGSANNIFSRMIKIIQFGFYHPGILMMNSKSLIGINMLRIADHKPEILQHVMKEVISLAEKKLIVPAGGKDYSITQLAEAHDALESGKTIGKLIVKF